MNNPCGCGTFSLEKKVGLLNPFASCVMDVMSEAEKHGTPLCHASLLRSIVSAWMESLTSEEGRSPEFSQTLVLVEKLAQVCHPRWVFLVGVSCGVPPTHAGVFDTGYFSGRLPRSIWLPKNAASRRVW